MIINYLSLWIANLGVDPLLAIMFFLALPAFFFLNLLLALVCVVLEAIVFSLFNKVLKLYKNRGLFLSTILSNVKVFLISYSLLVRSVSANISEIKEIFISKGEQHELIIKNITKFSVGNKEVLKHLYQKKHHKILIKGKKIGFSDLIIWSDKEKQTYHVYVISKKDHMKKIVMIESLKKLGLNIKVQGEIVSIYGEIKKLEQYYLLNKILSSKPDNLIVDVQLYPKLKKDIIAKAMLSLYRAGAKEVKCDSLGVKVSCSTNGLIHNKELEIYLKEKLNIDLDYDLDGNTHNNFIASLQIIQIETQKDSKYKLGLTKITSSIKEVLDYGNTFENEMVFIGNQKVNITTLAEPKTMIMLKKPANIQLGGEIPYQSINSNNITTTQWRFYGLKVKLILDLVKHRSFLKYEAELTSPSQNSISGSKGSSAIYVKPGKYIKLFEIGHKVNYDEKSYLPHIGEIPIINKLFSATNEKNSNKHIICFLKLEKVSE